MVSFSNKLEGLIIETKFGEGNLRYDLRNHFIKHTDTARYIMEKVKFLLRTKSQNSENVLVRMNIYMNVYIEHDNQINLEASYINSS